MTVASQVFGKYVAKVTMPRIGIVMTRRMVIPSGLKRLISTVLGFCAITLNSIEKLSEGWIAFQILIQVFPNEKRANVRAHRTQRTFATQPTLLVRSGAAWLLGGGLPYTTENLRLSRCLAFTSWVAYHFILRLGSIKLILSNIFSK